jgi:tRNA(fMet)-specific endonuclease VapC
MRFLLDTDHISVLQKQSGQEYAAQMGRIAQVPVDDLAFCIVSFHEQVLGFRMPIQPRRLNSRAGHPLGPWRSRDVFARSRAGTSRRSIRP